MTDQKYYSVDAAMLGQEWTGDIGDLIRFCKILQEITGAEIIPVTDSYNGAYNDPDGWEPNERDWNQALMDACDERPYIW